MFIVLLHLGFLCILQTWVMFYWKSIAHDIEPQVMLRTTNSYRLHVSRWQHEYMGGQGGCVGGIDSFIRFLLLKC